jgi:hypothetical protein
MLAAMLIPADSGEIELGQPELLALLGKCVELGTTKLNCVTVRSGDAVRPTENVPFAPLNDDLERG